MVFKNFEKLKFGIPGRSGDYLYELKVEDGVYMVENYLIEIQPIGKEKVFIISDHAADFPMKVYRIPGIFFDKKIYFDAALMQLFLYFELEKAPIYDGNKLVEEIVSVGKKFEAPQLPLETITKAKRRRMEFKGTI